MSSRALRFSPLRFCELRRNCSKLIQSNDADTVPIGSLFHCDLAPNPTVREIEGDFRDVHDSHSCC